MNLPPNYSTGRYPIRSKKSIPASDRFWVYLSKDKPRHETTSDQIAVQPISESKAIDSNCNQWTSATEDCLPGLQYLKHIDKLIIQQDVDLREVFLGVEFQSRFTIINDQGQMIYTVAERSNCFTRFCLASLRNFEIFILDHQGQKVMHLTRPLRCQECCYPCCLQRMNVMVSNQIVGYVEQTWNPLFPRFRVCNAQENIVLTIKGPFCTCGFFSDVLFYIYDREGDIILGQIIKKWTSLRNECCTNADNYSVYFPQDLDVNIKAVLIGAVFLIDYMFFETSI